MKIIQLTWIHVSTNLNCFEITEKITVQSLYVWKKLRRIYVKNYFFNRGISIGCKSILSSLHISNFSRHKWMKIWAYEKGKWLATHEMYIRCRQSDSIFWFICLVEYHSLFDGMRDEEKQICCDIIGFRMKFNMILAMNLSKMQNHFNVIYALKLLKNPFQIRLNHFDCMRARKKRLNAKKEENETKAAMSEESNF